MNDKEFRPIGWANTLISLKEAWSMIMTIENSPLRKLDPRVGHMIFTILGFMWSGIFGIAIMESMTAFTVSAIAHICIITGIAITWFVFNEADKRPDSLNETVEKGFKFMPGYHSSPRARQNMYVNGEKFKLDNGDPGGEHE